VLYSLQHLRSPVIPPDSTPAAVAAPGVFTLPPLIKRNMALFALSQSFTGAGMQFAYGFGPLMVLALTGSAGLAGLSVALIGFSRFLIAYPIGEVTDRFGRKVGIFMGFSLAIIGALAIGASMTVMSLAIFVVGLLIFGMGMNAAAQMRVAATDMVPPNHRARALGYMSLGSLSGLAVSPIVTEFATGIAARIGTNELGVPWFLLPALIIPGMILIAFVRPDPREIGMNLDRYYPGYKHPERKPGAGGTIPNFTAFTMLKNRRMLLAVVCNSAGTGNMSLVMVLTSLVLHEHGHSLTMIALSHMFHSCGMFAFTVPLGWLADKLGRTRVMYPGVGVALVGAGMVALTDGSYLLVTLGTFLVGMGWAAANVASTALIADEYQTIERGRAVGINESFSGGTSMVMALVTGPLIQWSGLPATGLAAMVLAAIPFVIYGYFKISK
jgi:MFS family permease